MSRQSILSGNNLMRAAMRLSLLIAVAALLSGSEALAAPPETMPIWRIQIYLETFNAPDAGSDDSVRVALRSNNGTWVDSPLDDWEIGSPRTYDLRLDGISRVSDIDYLRVSKTGSGGWCIGRIRLIVNGRAIYDEAFPFGHWLDNSGGHSTVYFNDDYFMRQRAEWINYAVPTRPNIVPVGDMKSRIQCLFGDFLTSYTVLGFDRGFRNSNPIAIGTSDANSWRVNVDLEEDRWPVYLDVDVDFDLTVAWMGSGLFLRPDFRVENLNVKDEWDSYAGDARYFMNNDFRPRINEMMKNFSYRIGSGIQLAPNGDLHFLPLVITPPPIDIEAAIAMTKGRVSPAEEIPVDTSSPLVLRVRTADEIKPLEETTLTAVVRSNLPEDADVELAFELPSPVSLAQNGVVAKDGAGERWLGARVETRADGVTLLILRDRLAAVQETTYTLRLMFQQVADATVQVTTRIAPDGSTAKEKITPQRATTYFRFDAGVIRSEGTSVRR